MLFSLQRLLIGAVLFLVIGFCSGWAVNGWRKDAELFLVNTQYAKAAEAHLKEARAKEAAIAAAQQITAELAVERERKNKIKERVITNDVIKYVRTPAAYNCGVDAAGVRLLNRAASGSDMPFDSNSTSILDEGS